MIRANRHAGEIAMRIEMDHASKSIVASCGTQHASGASC
ncbi:hypothetical protein GEM_2722 [Burkholderia cepacia GG4]|uniref:Uncharacterized protein n=1 Tax=Burkholderia cepacia GG4 TaxID=1009846 RepID=A0A9W3PA32_BURCE|nr:hypothetical protein GEM_2722 [Burkholderia cepacia GG4]